MGVGWRQTVFLAVAGGCSFRVSASSTQKRCFVLVFVMVMNESVGVHGCVDGYAVTLTGDDAWALGQ